jgi:hypothetical protein
LTSVHAGGAASVNTANNGAATAGSKKRRYYIPLSSREDSQIWLQ